MAFARPFAYNPGTTIPGTEQIGNLSIGYPTSGFTNNPQYWNGPNEELGYVIAESVSGNTQPTEISGVTASVGFYRTEDFTDESFVNLSEIIAQQSFSTAADAKTWLNDNGYWTSYESSPSPTNTPTPSPTNTETPTNTPTPSPTPVIQILIDPIITETDDYISIGNNEYLMFVDSNPPQITPTPTPTNEETPTPTPTNTPTETEVLTPTPTETETPTPTPTTTETETPTPTPTETPTNTPTPSTTPIPVTGYGYNLVVLPYAPPTSGNTIFPRFTVTGETSGVTTPNTFDVNGVFWNSIDNLSVDRTSYYSGMTGTSVTAYFTQNGDTAIYSGSSTAFTFEGSPGTFNYNPNTRPGQLTLIQSASTDFVTGQTVYISYVAN
jgi:hypothetical protein